MKQIVVPALACLLLTACETAPRSRNDRPPVQDNIYSQTQPYQQQGPQPLPPVHPSYVYVPGKPQPVASAGPLKVALIGSYMDNQEQDFRRALRGLGVLVARPGDDIVLNLRSDELFEGNSLDLTNRAQRVLAAIAPVLRRYDHTIVFINGYTDTTGSAPQNMAVSRKRAYTVGGQLVRDGVPLSRLQASGYGETALKVNTGDHVNEPRNRRIVIRIAARAAG